jgi:hypothetical protein
MTSLDLPSAVGMLSSSKSEVPHRLPTTPQASPTTMEQDDPTPPTDTGAGDDEILAALEAMESVMTALSSPGREFDQSLHRQHLELATKAGLDDQVEAARTMMVQSITCGEGESLARGSAVWRRRRWSNELTPSSSCSLLPVWALRPDRRLGALARVQDGCSRCNECDGSG